MLLAALLEALAHLLAAALELDRLGLTTRPALLHLFWGENPLGLVRNPIHVQERRSLHHGAHLLAELPHPLPVELPVLARLLPEVAHLGADGFELLEARLGVLALLLLELLHAGLHLDLLGVVELVEPGDALELALGHAVVEFFTLFGRNGSPAEDQAGTARPHATALAALSATAVLPPLTATLFAGGSSTEALPAPTALFIAIL